MIAREAESRGRSVYLYGAGAHSEHLLDLVADLPPIPLRYVLDDHAPAREFHGLAVRNPAEVEVERGSIVLISSDRWENELADRARLRFGDRACVVRLYEHLPRGLCVPPESAEAIARRRQAVRRARQRWGGGDFVGPYEQAGFVTGFLEEQWLWSNRDRLRGCVLDMSTPRYWHRWIYDLPEVESVLISDLEADIVTKEGYAGRVHLKGDFAAAAPPTPPHPFDSIVCLSILEHCADPRQMVRNLRVLLAPGGSLLLAVPFVYLDGHCRPDYWRFGRDGLTHLAAQAGFQEITTGGLGDVSAALEDVLGCDLAHNGAHDGLPLINWLIAGEPVR